MSAKLIRHNGGQGGTSAGSENPKQRQHPQVRKSEEHTQGSKSHASLSFFLYKFNNSKISAIWNPYNEDAQEDF